ncbi:PCI domain-containing protein 2 [Bonamia ostreae]|uniref:PCI domain-containing protein 2 n=1 Tax=Bonamia ostreae TaxID=126728 RepID=A0ABV2AM20_9EUKA
MQNADAEDNIEIVIAKNFCIFTEKSKSEKLKSQEALSCILGKFYEWMNLEPQKRTNWYMFVLLFLLKEYSNLSDEIDLDEKSTKWKFEADSKIKTFFRLVAQNRIDTINHPNFYIYGLVTELFKIYFKAAINLQKALNLTKNEQSKTKILLFLIPIKALSSQFPTLEDFSKISKSEKALSILLKWAMATKNGDLKLFNELTDRLKHVVLNLGLEDLFLKVKSTTLYRNIVKKHSLSWMSSFDKTSPTKTSYAHHVPLHILQKAFDGDESSGKRSFEDIENILSNLIYDGLIKGYIARQRCLVLSKKLPFPPLLKGKILQN